jgi:hypothetical protein
MGLVKHEVYLRQVKAEGDDASVLCAQAFDVPVVSVHQRPQSSTELHRCVWHILSVVVAPHVLLGGVVSHLQAAPRLEHTAPPHGVVGLFPQPWTGGPHLIRGT